MYNQKQFPFTQEQLTQLAEFPKHILEHANKKLAQELLGGKSISNQFGYFLSICRNYKQPQATYTQKATTSEGKPKPSNFTQYVERGKWIPGARVINNDKYYQTTITHVETDYEFALNFEKAIHQRTIDDPDLARRCAKFDRNPIWSKLSDFDRDSILNQAHTKDCTCRKNEHAGLIMPDIAQKLADKIAVTTITPLEEQYLDESVWEEV